MESQDIDSGRKIEDTFYRNEKHYKTSYSIGKNTAVNTDLVEWKMNEHTLMDSELDDYSSSSGYMSRLFNPNNLDRITIRKIIMNMGEFDKVKDKELISALEWFEDVLNDSLNEKELEFISLFKECNKVSDVSDKLNVSAQAVSNKLTRLCDKVEKKLKE